MYGVLLQSSKLPKAWRPARKPSRQACSGSRVMKVMCPLRVCVGVLQIYGVFFQMLTASQSMEACEEAFLAGAQWFEAWAGAGHGDVDPFEMRIVVQQVRMYPLQHLSRGAAVLYADVPPQGKA